MRIGVLDVKRHKPVFPGTGEIIGKKVQLLYSAIRSP